MAELALNPTDIQESFGGQDIDTSASQKAVQRQLKQMKKQAVEAAKKKAVQLIAKRVAQQGVVRSVAIACGSTGVGLVVTYLIWTLQAIVANWMGHDKIIPKLEWWELILWAVLGLLLLLVLLLVIAALALAFAFGNPVVGATIVGSFIWDWVTN